MITSARAREILDRAQGRRLLLIGDLMMDEWVFGSVKRISPEAPIPVVTMPITKEARANKPGGAGNVAAILLGLGAALRVVGVVGDDVLGRLLLSDLEARGADVSGVLCDPDRPTTHKMRILAGHQQLLRIDTESTAGISPALAAEVRNRILDCVGEAEVVLVADYAKGLISPDSLPQEVVASTRAAGIPFCVDPKPVNMDVFRGASLVSPNESEALSAAGPGLANNTQELPSGISMPAPVWHAGRALIEKLSAEAVFVTRGEAGIAVFCADGSTLEVPASTESGAVGDATGCGDAVSATSALALAAGASYQVAAELANAAGGVVSRFVGVHSPEPREIVAWLERQA